MGLTDGVLAEPMDPNHNGCQVSFRNSFVRVVVAFIVIFVVVLGFRRKFSRGVG